MVVLVIKRITILSMNEIVKAEILLRATTFLPTLFHIPQRSVFFTVF